MSAPAPKGYQREAVNNALEIFRYAEGQLRLSVDDASNAAAKPPKPKKPKNEVTVLHGTWQGLRS